MESSFTESFGTLDRMQIHGQWFNFNIGDKIPVEMFQSKVLFLKEGVIKVIDNHEQSGILIFRLIEGDVAGSELFSANTPSFELEVEKKCVIAIAPEYLSHEWSCADSDWKQRLDHSRQEIYNRLFNRIRNSAVCMEMRIVSYLQSLKDIQDSSKIEITHAVIAKELGSVREVVSRSLKKLECEGAVELLRGRIILKK